MAGLDAPRPVAQFLCPRARLDEFGHARRGDPSLVRRFFPVVETPRFGEIYERGGNLIRRGNNLNVGAFSEGAIEMRTAGGLD